MPGMARPPESTSSVVTVFASTPGLRNNTPVTSIPSVTRSVSAAAYASAEYPSMIGSGGGMKPSACMKWSMKVTKWKPAASVSRTTSASVDRIVAGPPSQSNVQMWTPTCMSLMGRGVDHTGRVVAR